MSWLSDHLLRLSLTEDHEGYFLGITKAGLGPPSLSNLQWRTMWQQAQRRMHFSSSATIPFQGCLLIFCQSISLVSGSVWWKERAAQ